MCGCGGDRRELRDHSRRHRRRAAQEEDGLHQRDGRRIRHLCEVLN